jgi:HPt (histidine-containing phosphotransfer) domain-containing protein
MPLPDVSIHPALDKERVTELMNQTPNDRSLFIRLNALFSDEGTTLIQDIVVGLRMNDRSTLHDAIHKVKGSSAAMVAFAFMPCLMPRLKFAAMTGTLRIWPNCPVY